MLKKEENVIVFFFFFFLLFEVFLDLLWSVYEIGSLTPRGQEAVGFFSHGPDPLAPLALILATLVVFGTSRQNWLIR